MKEPLLFNTLRGWVPFSMVPRPVLARYAMAGLETVPPGTPRPGTEAGPGSSDTVRRMIAARMAEG